jgi:hypothetical protein
LVLELDKLIDCPLDLEHFLTIIRGNPITNFKAKQAYTKLIDKATLSALTKHIELFIVASRYNSASVKGIMLDTGASNSSTVGHA